MLAAERRVVLCPQLLSTDCLPGRIAECALRTKAESRECTHSAETSFLGKEIQLLLLHVREETKEPTLKSNIVFL